MQPRTAQSGEDFYTRIGMRRLLSHAAVLKAGRLSHLGACAAEGSAAATREKTVQFGITVCAQGTTLGLSMLPNCPRFSHVSLCRLLPRSLLSRKARPRHDGARCDGAAAVG